MLQDTSSSTGPTGLIALNYPPLPAAKLAEKRKIIEEIAHNDVKKVSSGFFSI